MPVKGLTDNRQRLPRVGKIHLGYKDPAKKGAPTATDYFVMITGHPQYKELVDTFGEEPKELRVMLPVDDEDKIASQYYRCYSITRGLICKGDGVVANRTVDTRTGALADRDSQEVIRKDVPCGGKECPDFQSGRCQIMMCLQFLLPEITGLGIWQIDTSSINSILNINGALDLIRAVYGRIAMVPLLLTLEPKEVISPVDGKKKTVRVLNLRSPDKLVDAAKRAMQKPLELLAGMGQAIDTPIPDDERPELIAPDWESPNDGPTEPMPPAEVQKAVTTLWPPSDNVHKVRPAITKPQEAEPTTEPTPESDDDNPFAEQAQESPPVAEDAARLMTAEEHDHLGLLLETNHRTREHLKAFVNGQQKEHPDIWPQDLTPNTLTKQHYDIIVSELGHGAL